MGSPNFNTHDNLKVFDKPLNINHFHTRRLILKESILGLHERLIAVNNFNKQFSKEFGKTGKKIGHTLKIRKPNAFTVREGPTMGTPSAVDEETTMIRFGSQLGVDFNLSSVEQRLEFRNLSHQVIQPSMSRLSAEVERRALQMIHQIPNAHVCRHKGELDFRNLLQADQLLNSHLTPRNEPRVALLNPDDQMNFVSSIKGQFEDSGKVSRGYREGLLGTTAGYRFYVHTMIPDYIDPVTPIVLRARETDTTTLPRFIKRKEKDGEMMTLLRDVQSALTRVPTDENIRIGQVFYANPFVWCHRETKQPLDKRVQLVVRDLEKDGDGKILKIWLTPDLVFEGPRQNAVVNPARTTEPFHLESILAEAEEHKGRKYRQSLLFHRDAFCYLSKALPKVGGTHRSSMESFDGINARFISDYDTEKDVMLHRFDIYIGFGLLNPHYACRILTPV
ncbi:MAG: hypothetical protein N0E59_02175 [Candidatus Thiodiazotropha taylori]|nr:hypothetical protein [Candidatus Thiodiazotropha taylori]MCG8051913.1 hypothetical protein [Candidatus Thiodiazotropha taylori]MCG8108685.1 hypothetical protein [Candidatus Thiodiazotropha taylori]MCG8109549.1 hypothetical protein [Candidatus Thiodiazotropha taylori]MCW4281021.1 hypothetical protein [Candidatus Thiodiazotropha taylori]